MPKATPKPKTTFRDKDLASPEHDRILLWLHEAIPLHALAWMGLRRGWPKNLVETAKAEIEAKRQYQIRLSQYVLGDKNAPKDNAERKEFENHLSWGYDGHDESDHRKTATETLKILQRPDWHLDVPTPPPYPGVTISQKWQVRRTIRETQTRGRDVETTLGYIDLVATFFMPTISLNMPLELHRHKGTLRWSTYHTDPYVLWFDVRAEIPNLAILLRDIDLLEVPSNVAYFVVSTDHRFREILEHHGRRFLKAPAADKDSPPSRGAP